MNQQQKKYALKRIETIRDEKVKATRGKAKYEAERFTDRERFEAFKKGEYKMRPGVTEIGGWTDLVKVCVFKDEENIKKIELANSKIKRDIEKKVREIVNEADNVADEVMLGDEKEALRLIRAFAA